MTHNFQSLKSCWSIDHHKVFLIFLSFSQRQWLPPDTGVRSWTVVSDGVMSHASILKAFLINWLPYWVTEQTHFVPGENPLVIPINTDTRMNAYRCRERNGDEDRHNLKKTARWQIPSIKKQLANIHSLRCNWNSSVDKHSWECKQTL